MNPKQSLIRQLKWVILIALIAIPAGCGTKPLKTSDEFIKQYGFHNIHQSGFTLCYNYGCVSKVNVSLTEKEWQPIRNIFTPAPEDSKAERALIAKSIQILERLTGEKTNINSDIGGTFPGVFKGNQMDCEDEAVNTNIFLILLQNDQLLKFHRVYGIARRGFFPNGWPHMATAIIDTSSKEIFVVDSWFFDHGMPVNIVSEKIWKSGWKPDESEYDKYSDQPLHN